MRELAVELDKAVERYSKRSPWRKEILEGAAKKLIKLAPEPAENGRPDFLILSEDTLKDMRDDILRHPTDSKIARGQAINDLLFALSEKELYAGRYLNVPTQIRRRLAVKLQETSPEQTKALNFITARLDDMDCLHKSEAKEISADPERDVSENSPNKVSLEEAFSHFLVSAMLDGALSNRFLTGIFDVRSVDVTFEPFSIDISNHPDASTGDGSDDIARYRLWLSQRTAIYFLRFLLLLVTARSTGKYHYSELYLFPDEFRNKDKKIELFKECGKWINETLASADMDYHSFTVPQFRDLCSNLIFQELPCFVVSMLTGEVTSSSYYHRDLELLDGGLGKGPALNFKRGKQETSKTMRKKAKLLKQARQHRKDCQRQLGKRAGFHNILAEIGKMRRSVAWNSTMRQRFDAAERLIPIIRLCESRGNEYKCYKNLQLYCLWLKDCLMNSSMKVKTIKTYGSGLEKTFLIMLGTTAIEDMELNKIKQIIRLTMSIYSSKNIRTSIISFTEYLEGESGDTIPEMKWGTISWYDVTLNKADIKRTKPIVTFEHLLQLLGSINKGNSKNPTRLRIAILLGFFAGLRISEICQLDKDSLIFDGGWVLMVRHSKSHSGIRDIPLSYLIPQPYLDEVVAFFMAARTGGHESPWLFSEGDPYSQSIDYSHEAANLFSKIELENYRFHHLRHSFANWFILRWFAAYFGKQIFPSTAKFLGTPMFRDITLANIRRLLSGHGKAKKGQRVFVYVLQALAKIIGHSGPATTMTNYLHICDYLYCVLMYEQLAPKSAKLCSISVKQLLQFSYPSLPADFRKKKHKKDPKIVSLDIIIRHQVRRLSKKMNAANKRPVARDKTMFHNAE